MKERVTKAAAATGDAVHNAVSDTSHAVGDAAVKVQQAAVKVQESEAYKTAERKVYDIREDCCGYKETVILEGDKMIHRWVDCWGNVKETARPYATMDKVSHWSGICGEQVMKLGDGFRLQADRCCGRARQIPELVQDLRERALNRGNAGSLSEQAELRKRIDDLHARLDKRVEDLHGKIRLLLAKEGIPDPDLLEAAKDTALGAADAAGNGKEVLSLPTTAPEPQKMDAADSKPGLFDRMVDAVETTTGVEIDGKETIPGKETAKSAKETTKGATK